MLWSETCKYKTPLFFGQAINPSRSLWTDCFTKPWSGREEPGLACEGVVQRGRDGRKMHRKGHGQSPLNCHIKQHGHFCGHNPWHFWKKTSNYIVFQKVNHHPSGASVAADGASQGLYQDLDCLKNGDLDSGPDTSGNQLVTFCWQLKYTEDSDSYFNFLNLCAGWLRSAAAGDEVGQEDRRWGGGNGRISFMNIYDIWHTHIIITLL